MENNALITSLNTELGISIPIHYAYEKLHETLAAYLNELINTDFEKLVTFLYRIDVSEQKLKKLLQEHAAENAGTIMATLVIDRQLQKIRSREQFSSRDNSPGEQAGIDDAEKW
jgi:hypothetical protein